MAWFGKKKQFPALADWPAEDRWSIAEGENDGQPMLVRLNATAKDYVGHPDLPVRLGMAVPFHAPNDLGMPREDELEQVNEIEDRLFEALGPAGRVVLILTTGGMREFVSYVRSAADAERVAQAVREATDTHEVQHYAEPDPKWEVYGQWG